MKKYIFITIFFFCILGTEAQTYQYVPFPDSGAIWSEKWWDNDTTIFYRYTVCGEDTVVNGLRYNKVYMFYDSVFDKKNATFVGGMREDSSKRIFFSYCGSSYPTMEFWPFGNIDTTTKEFILYDFSFKEGDSMYATWQGNAIYLKKVDTILIDNTYRRRFTFSNFNFQWIEGIGSIGLADSQIEGGLFCTIPIGIIGPITKLLCFLQDDKVLYKSDSSYSSCFPSSVLKAEEKRLEPAFLKIFPNPVHGNYLHIELDRADCAFIKIMNAKGALIDTIHPKGQTELQVNVSHYLSGIYFYTAVTKAGKYYAGKFVVL